MKKYLILVCQTKILILIQELRKSKTKNLIGLVKKTDFDTKITKTGNKISDITDLVRKKKDFDTKLHNICNRGTSNKTNQLRDEMKVDENVS